MNNIDNIDNIDKIKEYIYNFDNIDNIDKIDNIYEYQNKILKILVKSYQTDFELLKKEHDDLIKENKKILYTAKSSVMKMFVVYIMFLFFTYTTQLFINSL
jgi:hypothetical protein